MIEPRLDAVAIELDLMHPTRLARRLFPQAGELGQNEVRQRSAAWVSPSRPCFSGSIFLADFFLAAADARLAPRGLPAARLARSGGAIFSADLLDAFPELRFDCQTCREAATGGNLLDRAAAHHRRRRSPRAHPAALRAALSSDLISSQGSCFSFGPLRMRTRCHRPLSFSPSSRSPGGPCDNPCADRPADTSGRGPRS